MAGIGLFNVFALQLVLAVINLFLAIILVAKHETVKTTRVTIGVIVLLTSLTTLIFTVLYLVLLTTPGISAATL
ncbi:hypothetical protein HYU19_01240 [Candidatus Woesearchaeota archaeon]|nr:hypothetical protein [Candidatus Woesearchaeota archaeon]